ncbi:cell division protein SepF [Schaalia vaccimaxillae]|uniref:cell division protein SepF n=1 Tax=Schaalia vaccimaxillae TaxID=183916 RepID=UPI0003B7A1AE|nr:cell division protein SepF [Schaalia vaccimaxillae]
MSESFGARARKFMGWPAADEEIIEQDQFEEYEEMAEVTPIAPVEHLKVATPARRETVVEAEDLSRIVTVHPTAYSDAITIGEAFRSGTPVIVNLTDMSEADARRLIDFAAGLTFGLHGVIERVTNRVFLLSPRTVEVAGDTTGARRGSLFNQG